MKQNKTNLFQGSNTQIQYACFQFRERTTFQAARNEFFGLRVQRKEIFAQL